MDNKDISYKYSLHAIDGKIEKLLDSLAPTKGDPTCKNGCCNCCCGEVTVSTAEARQLLDYIETQSPENANDLKYRTDQHIEKLKKSFISTAKTTPARYTAEQKIKVLGPCPFLTHQRCSIYGGRPYACRAMHSWNDSKFCGRAIDNAGTPLELYEIRNIFFSGAMKQEAIEGRYPFFGQLSIVVYYLMKFRDSYEDGIEFSSIIDPFWKDAGLIWFPYKNADDTLQQIIINIEHQQEAQRNAFNYSKILAQLP